VSDTGESKQATQIAQIDENRLLAPTTATELSNFLSILSRGGAFPETLDTKEKQVAVYQMARSLMGDRWQLAINHIAPVKGRLTIYGELPRAIAEQTKEVEEFRVYVIDSKYNEICLLNKNLDQPAWAGVCEVKRKGRAMKQFTYTIQEAEAAGQYPAMKYDRETKKRVLSPDSPWNKYTKVMLMRKAQALAVKFEFPDAMLGVPIAEYDHDVAPDLQEVKDVTPENKADKLNERFNGGQSEGLN